MPQGTFPPLSLTPKVWPSDAGIPRPEIDRKSWTQAEEIVTVFKFVSISKGVSGRRIICLEQLLSMNSG